MKKLKKLEECFDFFEWERTCQKCNKSIFSNDNFISMTEFNQQFVIGKVVYWHKSCWDSFLNPRLNQQGLMNTAFEMMKRTDKLLKRAEGKEEVEEIQI